MLALPCSLALQFRKLFVLLSPRVQVQLFSESRLTMKKFSLATESADESESESESDLVKTASVLSYSAYDQVKTRWSKSKAEAEEVNQSQSVGMCIVIGLSFPLLLPTPTLWFSLNSKRSRKKMETF